MQAETPPDPAGFQPPQCRVLDWRSDVKFLYGWHAAESDRIWCGGKSSALLMDIPHAANGVVVEFLLSAFTDPLAPQAQTLEVVANGWAVGAIASREEACFGFAISPGLLRPGVVLFTFNHVLSRVPASCGPHLSDERDLAFALLAARIWSLGPDFIRRPRGASHMRLSLDNRSDHEAARRELDRRFATPAVELVQSFESLGVDCEFGLLQRDCGCETLGLLRFSTVLIEPLLRGLDTGFAGLADPGHIVVSTDPGGEFMVSHTGYLLRYHTFVYDTDETADGIVAREVKRLPFLWRKLSEDLSEGQKIFVYKSFAPFCVHMALPILMRLQQYCTTNVLLVVNETSARDRQGSVEEVMPFLLLGCVDSLTVPEPGRDGRSVASWLEVCLNARSLLRLCL